MHPQPARTHRHQRVLVSEDEAALLHPRAVASSRWLAALPRGADSPAAKSVSRAICMRRVEAERAAEGRARGARKAEVAVQESSEVKSTAAARMVMMRLRRLKARACLSQGSTAVSEQAGSWSCGMVGRDRVGGGRGGAQEGRRGQGVEVQWGGNGGKQQCLTVALMVRAYISGAVYLRWLENPRSWPNKSGMWRSPERSARQLRPPEAAIRPPERSLPVHITGLHFLIHPAGGRL